LSDRVTIPWAVVALIPSTAVGLLLNYSVEARWAAPIAMAAIMGGLIVYGRIPGRKAHERNGGGL
jgi:hypothetical protein